MEIAGSIGSIYATARLGALLAGFVSTGKTDYIWFWLAIDIAAGIVITLGFFAMNYAKRILYFSFVSWASSQYLATMCRIDLAEFYDKDMRNTINKVSGGYSWQLSNLAQSNMDLMYGILRFIAITVVVTQITWWLVPLIALFLLPTLFAENRLSKLQWFVWDLKGDERHIYWGIDYIIRQAKSQMEIRSTQAKDYLLGKIRNMNDDFYATQEQKFKHASQLVIPTRIVEVLGTGVGSVVLLRQLLSKTITLDRYFFLSGALLRIGGALNNVFGVLTSMQESLLFADSFFTLTDMQPVIVDRDTATKLTKTTTPEIVL
jgi:ABC-type multidrug transport system fused ATPase/permease subunit